MRIKVQCENCPARNRRVRMCTFTKNGNFVRKMALCEACAKIAMRLTEESAPVVENASCMQKTS